MRTTFACLVLIIFTASAVRAQLNAYFINVGQGDATYLELPNGSNVLIDGGPSAQPIYRFLNEKGITKIDHVVLTHPHSDHYRGLKKVFAAFDVKNFYDTMAENLDAKGDNNLRELAAAEPSCRTHFPEVGANMDWDKHVTVKVLNTCSEPVISRNNDIINNCSLVLRFYYNGNSILLMGDAEASVENAMAKIFKSGLSSTYLKVGHHGSRYSSTEKFLSRVQPKVAVISVGQDNTYGHPHREALDRIMATGAQVFFTLTGTQSLTIPAPKGGTQLLVNGQPNFGDVAVTEIPKFNMEEWPFDKAYSASLEQLKEAADVK
ncbi:MAG TPA: hypothetical protein DCS63_01310 [Elusimicrobia bacterium]|nr:hypothetical protein [Elusimicrobiota bacterium]